MSKGSGSVRGGLQPNDGNYTGKIGEIYDLITIKEPTVYKATKEAISRYHSVMGVRQREVKLATLDNSVYGVHVTGGDGKSKAVYLNKKHFDQKLNVIKKEHKRGYDSGWSTKTNKPIAHTVTHELAHATWNSHLTSTNAKAASKEIKNLFVTFKNDKKKKGYGEYAHSNVNEFWAETTTKAVHGKADKYTKSVKNIAKKYNL